MFRFQPHNYQRFRQRAMNDLRQRGVSHGAFAQALDRVADLRCETYFRYVNAGRLLWLAIEAARLGQVPRAEFFLDLINEEL